MRSIEIVLALVALGAVGAAFADRLRIPAPSLMVLAGLVVGLLPGCPRCGVSPDVVSFVVLVGADNSVTAADLVSCAGKRRGKFGIWLRGSYAVRHFQFS